MLDIGAGSGLLSMMAARAGAGMVTAVERVEALARCALEIATANGYAGRVAIIHGESAELEPLDLEGGRHADLLVSEVSRMNQHVHYFRLRLALSFIL